MNRAREHLTLLWHGPVNRTTAAAIAHGQNAVIYLRSGRAWWRATHPMSITDANHWWRHALPEPLSAPDTSRSIDLLIRRSRRARRRLTGALR